MGLDQVEVVPQICFLKLSSKLGLFVTKIVDELLITGEETAKKRFISWFKSTFKLGTLTPGPGNLWFSGLNIFRLKISHLQLMLKTSYTLWSRTQSPVKGFMQAMINSTH